MAFWQRAAVFVVVGLLATGGEAGAQQWTAEAMKGVDEVLQGRVRAEPEVNKAELAQPVTVAAQFDFKAAVAEIRAAERLVLAALETGDSTELRSVESKLIRLESLVLEAKPGDNRASCGLAAGDLAAVGSSLRKVAERDEPARHLVAAKTIEGAYRRHLAECERALRVAEGRTRR